MHKIAFEIVPPTEDAAQLIMRWRNDPETLKWSFDQTPKVWPAFAEEFFSSYTSDPTLPCFFVTDSGKRIGLIRFRRINSNEKKHLTQSIDISINLASESRRKGLGKASLHAVVTQLSGLLRGLGFSTILAEIFAENIGSQKAFEHAGFKFTKHYVKTTSSGTNLQINQYQFTLHDTYGGGTELSAIGDGHPTFIIAEAGSNWRMGTHKRDLKMGYTLIEAAKEAGCDAVKFQTYRAETTYVKEAGTSDYLALNGIREDISEIFKDLSMPYEMLEELSNHAKRLNITFMSSPFSICDLQEVDRFTPIHKIASYEINHCRLIDAAAETGKPLIISTGASNLNDIENALKRFRARSNSSIFLMQCTAKYPAPLSTLNLSVIPYLKARFGVPVGLSDHSRDAIVGPVTAVALGANLLEKHYTLNNDLPGPDHKFALTTKELTEMVSSVRKAEESLGTSIKQVLPEEDELFKFARRGLQALTNISKGEPLVEGKNFDILRPGKQKQGMNPMNIQTLQDARSRRDIAAGDGIQCEDLVFD